jgi:16S rRNA (uracil1498-N3)-methyltransferase
VNLLLVEPAEVIEGMVSLTDRRARHLREVLGATIGARVRAGLVGGALATAEVIADDGARIELRLELQGPPPPPLPIELALAVPRPKVLSRVIEAATSFAVQRIALTNAWRVDKSYLGSPRLAPAALAATARLGAEQGATTYLPQITVHRRLMALLDERWPAPGADLRLIAHPGGIPIERAAMAAHDPMTLAIGPEGGWIAREVDTFVARGFVVVSLAATILRVETAVAAALGQLALLRRMAGA